MDLGRYGQVHLSKKECRRFLFRRLPAAAVQPTPREKRSRDLRLIELHQLRLHEIAFDHAEGTCKSDRGLLLASEPAHSFPRQLPVLDPMRVLRGGAEPHLSVRLVFRIVAVEPDDLAVTFEREDIRRDPIEKPAIVRDHNRATGEAFQRFFTRGGDRAPLTRDNGRNCTGCPFTPQLFRSAGFLRRKAKAFRPGGLLSYVARSWFR